MDALGLLYDRHASAAFGLAARMTNDRETAEEIVQDAFTSFWRSAPSYDASVSAPRTWLLSIVRNRAIDRLRSRRNRPAPAPLEEAWMLPAVADVQAEVQAGIERQALRAAVATLPASQRRTLELAYFGGQTFVEIAAAMGVSVGTVKSRARLAIQRLRNDAELAATVSGRADTPPTASRLKYAQ
jgi:RNA polymerase sigma-70 factor (ECF subfamily)